MASNKPRFGGGTETETTLYLQSVFAMDGKKRFAVDLSEEASASSKSLMAGEGDRPVSFRMVKDFGHQGSPKREADEKQGKNRIEKDLRHPRQNPVGGNLHAVGVSAEPTEKALHDEAFKEMIAKPTASLKDGDNENTVPSSVRGMFELHAAAKPDDALCGEASAVPQIQTLISVFEELGISAPVKPYARLNDKKLLTTEYTPSDVIYCKNLFLKDRKGQFYLVITPEDGVVDLKRLKQELGAHRNLSFADSHAMAEILGVQPGAVTPLALINESTHQVKLFIHQSLVKTPGLNARLAFHPLVSHLQVELSYPELRAFVEKCGVELKVWGYPGQEGTTSDPSQLGEVCDKNKSSEEVKEKAGRTPREICSKNLTGIHKPDTRTTQFQMDDKETETTSSQKKPCYTDTFCIGDYHEKSKGLLSEEKRMEKQTSIGQEEDVAATLRSVAAVESRNILMAEDDQQACVKIASPEQKKKVATSYTPALLATREHKGKGKLRSYLKKSNSLLLSSTDGLANLENDSHNDSLDPGASWTETPLSKADSTSGCQVKREPPIRIAEIKQSRLSPQVETFYNKLSAHKVSYQEIDLSSSDSLAIGPSVGTRSFLLKDKANNFFFVISHELYELDYGRLKLALRPKKKLQRVTEEEIITVLGVHASRVTPFALMNGINENVQVFITEKILPGNVVLCVQHPYAAGHRIVLSSSELQHLLASLEVKVRSVKEKKWAEKYSFAFSQFNGLDAKPLESNRETAAFPPASGETLSTKSGKVSSIDDDKTRNPRCGGERIDENKAISSARASNFSREGLSRLSRVLLNLFFSERRDLSEGTSVDAESCAHNDGHQNSVDSITNKTSNRKIPVESTKGEAGASQSASVTSKDGEEMRRESPALTVDGGCSQAMLSQPDASSSSDKQKRHLTTEDILDHLNYFGVRFQLNLPRTNCKRTQFENEHSSSSDNEIFEGATSDDDYYKIRENVEGDEDEMRDDEEDDCIELCSTIHMKDEENSTYVIVGGESDVVSSRRFRRHFQIKTKLKVVSEGVADAQALGLCVSPFSAFLSDDSTKFERGATTLFLTTSVYIDEETKLKFMLDQSGTAVIMTSRELERYVRAMGVEVSYIP